MKKNGVLLLALASSALAQSPPHITGHVVDQSHHSVAGATVGSISPGQTSKATTDANGSFVLDRSYGTGAVVLKATAAGQTSNSVPVPAGSTGNEIELILHPEPITQTVTVTASRLPLEIGATANSITTLSAAQLQRFPAFTLDDSLRQHAGFELFRRSSSWVANPTSQGISLRGLGSTAASRTLVLLQDVPLNDPFGGWIHWNELPPAAIQRVEIASGGGSDLYGSSAIGGVVNVIPAEPANTQAVLNLSGAGEATASGDGRLDLHRGPWSDLVAGQIFHTDGYRIATPSARGAVDVPANVHFQNGRTALYRALGGTDSLFLEGNVLNEARTNGTPVQRNATRLWRYVGGGDWNPGHRLDGALRLYGSNEGYRQSFSSISSDRNSERLTRLQRVRTQELGGAVQGSIHLSRFIFLAGADIRDIRATDLEQPVRNGAPAGSIDTPARQRFAGGFSEALLEAGPWSAALSGRVDVVRNFDASTLTTTAGSGPATRVSIADRTETVTDPRFGLVRRLPHGVSLRSSAFRAFRAPTLNELYRTGQVGQETTEANADLRSERATGWEVGSLFAPSSGSVTVEGTYFWTVINRAVSAVALSRTSTTILNRRENLGQIRSEGVALDLEAHRGAWLSGKLSYQYANAVVTSFAVQQDLVDKWIPEVPRQSAVGQLRVGNPRIGDLLIVARGSGRAYDDASNIYLLHSFVRLDLYGEKELGTHASLFASVQNALDRTIEVGRTPVLTLGTPLVAQVGIRLHTAPRQ